MKLFLNKAKNLALKTKAPLKRLFFSMEHIFSFLKYVALTLLVVVMSFRFYHQANEASEMYSIEEFSGSEKLVKNNWIKTLASEISSNCLVLNKNLDETIKSRSEKFTSSRSTSIQQLRKSENPTVAVKTQSIEKNDKFDIKGIMAAGLNLFEIKEKIISGSISEDTISKTYHLTINTPFGINDTVNVSQNCPDALSQLSKRASVKISQIINPYAWVDSFIFDKNFKEARVILEKLEARRSYDADFKNSESDSVKIVHRWVNYYVSQAKLNLDSVDFDLKKKDGKSKIYFHRRIEALKTAEHYIKIQLEGKTSELSFSCLKVAVIKDIILSVKNYKQYQIIPNYFNEDSNLIKLARDCYNTPLT